MVDKGSIALAYALGFLDDNKLLMYIQTNVVYGKTICRTQKHTFDRNFVDTTEWLIFC